jgi:hypothetical protein
MSVQEAERVAVERGVLAEMGKPAFVSSCRCWAALAKRGSVTETWACR